LFQSKQKLSLAYNIPSYNIKQTKIDNVRRNKPNMGKITFKKSRKSGEMKNITKILHNTDLIIQFPIALNVRNTLMWFN
jgi:hypothetical protein